MSDGDGVEDEVGRAARVALTVALQLGDKFARLREDLARDALRTSEAEARSLAARFSAERDVARAQLAVVDRPDWWQRAELQQVADVLQTAQQWKDLDPVAERATQTIAREVQERFGVDVADIAEKLRGDQPADFSAEKALAVIAAAEATDRVPEPGSPDPLNEVKALAGQDAAVDAAIAEKFPQLLTDEQRAAVDGARSESIETTAEAVVVAGMMDADERRADASRDEPTDAPTDQGGSESAQQNVDQAAALELQARAYETQAEEGGTAEQSPDQLRALADDARAQAQLYRDDPEARTAADSAASSEFAAADKDLSESIAAGTEAESEEARSAALHEDAFQGHTDADHRAEEYDDRFQMALDSGSVPERIDFLNDQAAQYEKDADAGGTATQTPDELRSLAAEHRNEAAYFQDGSKPSDSTRSADVASPSADRAPSAPEGRASTLRAESDLSYDSAARRTVTANEMKSREIPQDVIDVKMRADIAQGRPASEAVAQAGRVHVPNTNHHRSAGRSQQRSEQAR